MTTVTKKILTHSLNVTETTFDFQLMYMPMDSEPFYNDDFAEVLATMFPVCLYAIIGIGARVVAEAADSQEIEIQ